MRSSPYTSTTTSNEGGLIIQHGRNIFYYVVYGMCICGQNNLLVYDLPPFRLLPFRLLLVFGHFVYFHYVYCHFVYFNPNPNPNLDKMVVDKLAVDEKEVDELEVDEMETYLVYHMLYAYGTAWTHERHR